VKAVTGTMPTSVQTQSQSATPTGDPGSPISVRRRRLHDFLQLVRPTQWAKNLLVVPAALLTASAPDLTTLARLAWAVGAFTLASSLAYICNDIADRDRDRQHPVKRHRPIAAGRIGKPVAVSYAVLLAMLLTSMIFTIHPVPWWPVLTYLVLNLAYSRRLKHVPLVDVFIVAAGFLLRVLQGALAIHAPVSNWLLGAVFTLCLFLIVGKRRNEMANGGSRHRPSLASYTVPYLEHLMLLCATVSMITFLMFLHTARFAAPHTDTAVLISLVFAMFALARYLQVVMVRRDGGDPVRILLRDRALVLNAVLWLVGLGATLAAAQHPLSLFASN
jgi:decaprenyl-phosphate phosphoribosyltransferase